MLHRVLAARSVVLAVMLSSVAHAQDLAGDMALARTYFEAGQAGYARGDYKRALAAFEEARRLRPLPELDYDIAACHEKLGQPAPALEFLQRYLDAVPSATNAAEIEARIATLRARLASNSRNYIAPGVVLGTAVIVGAVGAALAGSVASPLRVLKSEVVNAMPTPGQEHSRDLLRDRSIAGDVLLGVAGALVVVDIALWVRAARRGSR